MSKFIDAFARIRPRLLAMSPLVAAGAVASVVAAPDPATTGVIVAVVLQTLGNLAGNIAATDLHATLAERVLRDDVLKNHDLARAVRDAIGAIISRAAKDIPDENETAALYEILKEDFAQDGKAYGGLLIKLVGNISAMQVETRKTA